MTTTASTCIRTAWEGGVVYDDGVARCVRRDDDNIYFDTIIAAMAAVESWLADPPSDADLDYVCEGYIEQVKLDSQGHAIGQIGDLALDFDLATNTWRPNKRR
jgi:hypothetical protein